MLTITNKDIRQLANEAVKKQGSHSYALALIPALITSILMVFSSPTKMDTYYWLGIIWGGIYPFFLSVAFLRLSRQEHFDWQAFTIKEFKENGTRLIIGQLLVNILVFFWSLLFLIPGLIKQFSYILTPFIIKDHPDIHDIEAVSKSRQLMHGNKGKLFMLAASYYVWPFVLYVLFCAGILATMLSGISAIAVGQAGLILAGLIGILALASLIAAVILTVRIAPRWHMALAIFYDDVMDSQKKEKPE